MPEYAPVQHVYTVMPGQPSGRPGPESIQPDKNSPKNSTRGENLDEFLRPSPKKDELTPVGRGVSKPKPDPKPTTPLQPKFTAKLFDREQVRKKRGRQRAKDRNSEKDGVRQLFELWWRKASKGLAFSTFYRNHLSKDMRAYYPREYIYGANQKSAAEYRQWRAEWDARNTAALA